MIKKIILSIFLLVAISSYSQDKNINNYKYVIVPTKFDFLKLPDQYRTSSLLKYILNKEGFKAYLSSDKLPADLAKNRCLALTATVEDASGFLTIKNIIKIKDCFNNVLFTSQEGKSKIKDYKRAYYQTINRAARSLKPLRYKYSGKEINTDIAVVNTDKTKQVKAASPTKVKFPVKEVKQPVKTQINKEIVKVTSNRLYAQPIKNGYQLVNTKPEVVFQILKSSRENFYFIKDKNGVLFKKGNSWIAEFYENEKLVQQQYQIKF